MKNYAIDISKILVSFVMPFSLLSLLLTWYQSFSVCWGTYYQVSAIGLPTVYIDASSPIVGVRGLLRSLRLRTTIWAFLKAVCSDKQTVFIPFAFDTFGYLLFKYNYLIYNRNNITYCFKKICILSSH
jgi:hypothetical protein